MRTGTQWQCWGESRRPDYMNSYKKVQIWFWVGCFSEYEQVFLFSTVILDITLQVHKCLLFMDKWICTYRMDFKKNSLCISIDSVNILVPWNSPDYYKTCSLEIRCQSRNTKVVYTMWYMLYFAQQICKCQDIVVSFLYWYYKTHLVPSPSNPECPTQPLLENL